jgi:D-amino-acid dehydrogenase
MKILILGNLDKDVLDHFLCSNVLYRPDLPRKNPSQLKRTILEESVDAVIATEPVCPDLLAECTRQSGEPLHYVRVTIGTRASTLALDMPGEAARQCLIAAVVEAESLENAFSMAFTYLEQQSTATLAARAARQVGAARAGRNVLLVGAGLVNLITAHRLLTEGFSVRIVDGGPDPRQAEHWKAYGCSRGGDDARMFTLSEMDNYNDRSLSASMNSIFNRSVVDLGWNVYWRGTLSAKEQAWPRAYESIPTWLANQYNEDIFAFNRESRTLWDKWLAKERGIFEECVLREGILRIYSDQAQFRSAVERQNRIGATLSVLSPAEVASQHPALASAVAAGWIAGGVHVVGFTVNAHKFMHRLLDDIESAGGRFIWKERVNHLVRDADRQVVGVRTTDNLLSADHYVLSPGAYAETLLEGTRSAGKIHGVLGAWLRLPNRAPELCHSLKLARKGHITEDANITVATGAGGEPLLIIGSGYGYTGSDPRNIDPTQLQAVYQGLIDTAEKYFPECYADALARGDMEDSLKYCVRPWTATGLGIFESIRAKGGGVCVITGGHNTGGFAQAPAVAQAVLNALQGREHAMHRLYDPDRAGFFLSERSTEDEAVLRPQHLFTLA